MGGARSSSTAEERFRMHPTVLPLARAGPATIRRRTAPKVETVCPPTSLLQREHGHPSASRRVRRPPVSRVRRGRTAWSGIFVSASAPRTQECVESFVAVGTGRRAPPTRAASARSCSRPLGPPHPFRPMHTCAFRQRAIPWSQRAARPTAIPARSWIPWGTLPASGTARGTLATRAMAMHRAKAVSFAPAESAGACAKRSRAVSRRARRTKAPACTTPGIPPASASAPTSANDLSPRAP